MTALLGTGFYVGPRPAVVTAGHVFTDNALAPGEHYAMAFVQPDDVIQLGHIRDYLVCKEYDIAVFAAGSVPGAVRLKLTRKRIPTNQDVLTQEFSGTTIEEREGLRVVDFTPFTHKGNIMRYYTSTFPESRPTPVFDTSFPALQGASGAPVIRAHDFVVGGMLVANFERHLVPAQVVRIVDNGRHAEETRYFLPTGKAIASSVLIQYLEQIKVEPEVID